MEPPPSTARDGYGSGKTCTIIALCKVLLDHGWVKNILFLADRSSLITQAKRGFVNLLEDLSAANLCEDKENYNAHGVFSTYQTMMSCIDEVEDAKGRLYPPGHFDLLICDETHRSIYNKYNELSEEEKAVYEETFQKVLVGGAGVLRGLWYQAESHDDVRGLNPTQTQKSPDT